MKIELGRARRISGLHPGKAARCDAGFWGELHPTLLDDDAWGFFELESELTMAVPERVLYQDVITFPANLQDIAVVVDRRSRQGHSSPPRGRRRGGAPRRAGLRRLRGRRSAPEEDGCDPLAFRAPDRTLSDDESRRFVPHSRRAGRRVRCRAALLTRSVSKSVFDCGVVVIQVRGRSRCLWVVERVLAARWCLPPRPGTKLQGGVERGSTEAGSRRWRGDAGDPPRSRAVELEIEDNSTSTASISRAPARNVGTGVEDIETKKFALTLVDGRYEFICDAHPTTMGGAFDVGTSAAPSLPSAVPDLRPQPWPSARSTLVLAVGSVAAASLKATAEGR